MKQYHWDRIGQFWNFFKAPEHGGLSSDGEYFFLAERDDEAYAVIEVRTGNAILEVQRDEDYPPLPEWTEKGHIEIVQGPAKGRYRVIGLEESYPLAVDEILGIAITIDQRFSEIALVDLSSQQEFHWLHYEIPSEAQHKWAVASFSDDGSTIAVLVDHAATFFRHDGPTHSEVQSLTNQLVPNLLAGRLWTNIGGL